ncbi:MAG TPA: DmsC/YnfH family molybdoenzyme membrane anchor subunit [Burkholderiales bacterium]|nr:DmsC/YnfH family molybdoenzyme membrane anchor subunit [Burkholderiales bacterium]
MRPAWSVILLTTLAGAGQGLFLVVFLLDVSTALPPGFALVACGVSLLLLVCGLAASFFHLGRPERAWRAASQWRTSWLSREVIVLPAFMGMVFLYGLLHFAQSERQTTLIAGAAAAALCLALFVCTGMIYACLKFLQEWNSPLTLVNFLLLGLASGFTLSALLAALAWPQAVGALALGAFFIGAVAWLSRCASLVRNALLRPKSTAATAIGIRHPRIVQKAQGFMGGSFNTREFFHGRPDIVVRATRWSFLLLVFPVPGWLLGWGGGSLAVLAAAFALQFAGLLAERWYFFAEARHPQNIYYQSMA